ncbi:MAG: alpha-L-fucosidase [Odoribacteraceae bacterium]|jgi:alpha-L-fucosidase|nr:alpha-L-fucosidase [Odoribacteraceae bacterium]
MKKWMIVLLISRHLVAAAQGEQMMTGLYEPSWESLARRGSAPGWFRDAKFGIWAHWGPQCQPEAGDWYGRNMYMEGSRQYRHHLQHYGHPSVAGFKEVIGAWKADEWNPDRLLELYRRAGARYFLAMGNHHDNFDLWDSKHQPWNSMNMGPRRDILDEWATAARARGLFFGVSIHSAHAWTWYETARGADKNGPLAGAPYDGLLSPDDGKGAWWEGYDPNDLYAQQHPPSAPGGNDEARWEWADGAAIPSEEYCRNFFDRTADMINRYRPDLVYFDDYHAPLWPVSDQGLRAVAHLYNSVDSAVAFAKMLAGEEKKALTWDVEKGAPPDAQPLPWQTCSCLGGWHYDRELYLRDGYKSARDVIQMLIDIVSKNGNLLLSVPLRANGTIDEKEEAILEEIAAWMEVNGQAIHDSRPWSVFGEGPSTRANAGIINERQRPAYTPEDIRFTARAGILYAHLMAPPDRGQVLVKSLSKDNPRRVRSVTLLGNNQQLNFKRTREGLLVNLPGGLPGGSLPLVLAIR